MDKFGQKGLANVYVIAIVAAILGAVGIMWYLGEGPFEKEAGVDLELGIILEDGTEMSLSEETPTTFYMTDPNGERIYDVSDLDHLEVNGKTITGVFADLYVKAATESSGQTVSIDSWQIEMATQGGTLFASNSGVDSIQSGSRVKVGRLKETNVTAMASYAPPDGSYTFDFTASVSASRDIGNLQDTDKASGSIEITRVEGKSTLTITASIDTGPLLELVE